MSLFIPYTSLDPKTHEIRLLRLRPSKQFHAPLEGAIFHASLKDSLHLDYEALSYVWGDPTPLSNITIEGVTEGPAKITSNLSIALRHLRNESSDLILWADAICINQSDLKEREHQVQLMACIYNGARNVTAWLGEGDEDSNFAISLVNAWASTVPPMLSRILSKFNTQETAISAKVVTKILEESPLIFSARATQAIIALGTRTYWTRAWILQELAFATRATVRCGKKSISLALVERAAKNWTQFSLAVSAAKVEGISSGLRQLSNYWEELNGLPMSQLATTGREWRLSSPGHLMALPQDLLECLEHREATDPRDLVFSLLGFVDPDSRHWELIRPDYAKGLEQVFIDTAKYLILTDESLRALSTPVIEASINGRTNLPSWVPDWRTRQCVSSAIAQKEVRPSSLISRLIEFSSDGRVRTARGFELDTVTAVFADGLSVLELDNGPRSRRFMDDFEENILNGAPIKGETLLSALIRLHRTTYMGKMLQHESPALSQPEHIELSVKFLTTLRHLAERYLGNKTSFVVSRLATCFLGENSSPEVRQRLANRLASSDQYWSVVTCAGSFERRETLFWTASGRLGVGPAWMAVGDTLCHLAAHTLPFVLRPAGIRYRNVGPCIVLDLELEGITEDSFHHMEGFEIE